MKPLPVLSILLMSLSTMAYAQSDMHKPPVSEKAALSESQKAFDRLPDADLANRCTTPDGASISLWKWLRAMVEHEAHHRGQIFPAFGDLVGGDFDPHLAMRAVVRYLVDIDGGKRQQADQQEVADDDQDRAVHDGVAYLDARVGAGRSGGAPSASSSSFRRSGRRWKILKIETKTMPRRYQGVT